MDIFLLFVVVYVALPTQHTERIGLGANESGFFIHARNDSVTFFFLLYFYLLLLQVISKKCKSFSKMLHQSIDDQRSIHFITLNNS